jgi:FAD/FMN-containing dehydrogenase
MKSFQTDDIEAFEKGLNGALLFPGSAAYEDARRLWNGMIDKRPALIARCTATSDVMTAVNFARERNLPLAVRGGGHNIAGNAICDDGLVIDLTGMKAVNVDPAGRRASVGGGALLADFDAAAQVHGLGVPLGINSTTGVGGLALGGGFGWLSRKFGLTIDSLEWAEVVTAAGEAVRASASEHADLFWAIRGGGGNFGVVTRFGFRLHQVGPDLLSGLIVYPLAEASAVLRRYRDFASKAPDELSVWTLMRMAPPLPFLPEETHGKGIVALALLYAGDPAQGAKLIEPLRGFGTVLGEHVGVQPYVAWQRAFDPLLAPGARNYWKSHNFLGLEDGLFDALLKHAVALPSPQCEILFAAIGGAASRPSPDSSAYAQRDARFVMNVHGRWEDPALDGECMAWARNVFKSAEPFATGGVYVNFMTEDEGNRVKAAYGRNYERLAQVKSIYDPENLFRGNQNIKPVMEMAG